MARLFTDPQLALLKSGNVKVRLLTEWLMDGPLEDGIPTVVPYYFCDDVMDLTDGETVWIGASVLGALSSINSAELLSAESVTLTVDGTRSIGVDGILSTALDKMFRNIIQMPLHDRRVNFALGFMEPNSSLISFTVPIYAGRINNAKLTYPKVSLSDGSPTGTNPGKLDVVIDSLAARYGSVSGATRSNADQHLIDPNDDFYSLTVWSSLDITLYWGQAPPSADAGLQFAWSQVNGSGFGQYKKYI